MVCSTKLDGGAQVQAAQAVRREATNQKRVSQREVHLKQNRSSNFRTNRNSCIELYKLLAGRQPPSTDHRDGSRPPLYSTPRGWVIAPGTMKAHSDAWRVAVEVIYEDGGHSEICFSGLDEAELAHVNADIHGGKGAHVYGDTNADLLSHLFRELLGRSIDPDADCFCDLGSGSGKLLLQMLLLNGMTAIGIELSPTRHNQALAAVDEARAQSLFLPSGREPKLHCASMLGNEVVAQANLVYCYSLALSPEFLLRLRSELECSELPIGTLLVLRGQPFPAATESPARSKRACFKLMLETRIQNRVHQYFGYRLVEDDHGSVCVTEPPKLLELYQRAERIGETRFERQLFEAPEPEEMCSRMMQDLLEQNILV